MDSDLLKWLIGVLGSSGVVSAIAYFMRDTIAQFLTKKVEYQFEQKLETFKANIRASETELDQIRSFLTSARKEHDSLLQLKRFEAAEALLRARNALAQFSMLVEYMKKLKIENILKKGDDPKTIEFIETLIKPFEIDEKIKLLGAIDKTAPRLYLSEKSLKHFDAYESIILQAIATMRILSIPLSNKGDFFNAGNLSKIIIELVPNSKNGFDQFGESFAYHWSTYFHDEILRALRHEVSGIDDIDRHTASIERLALNSRQAQLNVETTLKQRGLPSSLIKEDENAIAATSAVTQATKE